MRKNRQAGVLTSLASLTGLAVAVSLGGCASTPDTSGGYDLSTRDPSSALPESYRETAHPRVASLPDASAEQLAEQARRDVEMLTSGQVASEGTAGEPDPAPPPPVRPEPPATTRSEPGEIQWTMPGPPSTSPGRERPAEVVAMGSRDGDRNEDHTTGETDPGRADDDRSAFVPGPLFVEAMRSIEVEPLPDPVRFEAGGETAAQAAPPDDPATIEHALETDRVARLMVDLSAELYRRSSYADMPLRELLAIAALSVVDPKRSLSADAIPGLTDREREILVHFQGFFRGLGERLDGGADADEVIQTAVTDLRAALVDEPEMALGTVALCYRIDGFGAFDEFDRYSFLAHDEQKVIVYIEVGDFTSELNGKGEWVTELSQQLIIYSDHDGIPVWTADWQPAVDVTKNKRQDFFTVQVVTLPKALSVGRYQLKVRMRDEKSGAETEHSLDFEMVADSKLAASMPAE